MWWLSYYYRGKEIRESSEIRIDPKKVDQGASKASKLLDQRRGEIATHTFIGPKQARITFADLTALIEQDYGVRGQRSWSTTAIRVQHLEAFFGRDARAVDITAKRIRDYQQHRLTEQAEAATINRETVALHRMFCLATKLGRLAIAACPVFPDRLEENTPRQGFLEQAEYEGIRAHLPPDYQDVLDFGYLTGWRRREVTGLTWDEVEPGRRRGATPPGTLEIETAPPAATVAPTARCPRTPSRRPSAGVGPGLSQTGETSRGLAQDLARRVPQSWPLHHGRHGEGCEEDSDQDLPRPAPDRGAQLHPVRCS